MKKVERPKIEELTDEIAFWQAFVSIQKSKDIDVGERAAELVSNVEQGLASPGARDDFAELCRDGCLPLALATAVGLLQNSTLLKDYWSLLVGGPNNRARAMTSLENAAQTLEELYSDLLTMGPAVESEKCCKIGRIQISRLISELRLHIKFISFAERISKEAETRTRVLEVPAYELRQANDGSLSR